MGIFDFLKSKKEVKKNKKVTKTKDGIFQLFYKNNQLKQEYNYKNGKKNGNGKEYYTNGQLKEEGNWENGKKFGLFKKYHTNGQLKEEGNWENGKLHGGDFIQYDKGGKITSQVYFSKMKQIQRDGFWFYKEKELSKEYQTRKDNKGKVIEVSLNYISGEVYLLGEELKKGNSQRYMLIKTYHLNGQQELEVEYDSEGRKNWFSKNWDEKGNYSEITQHINNGLYIPPTRSLTEVILEGYIREIKGKYYP